MLGGHSIWEVLIFFGCVFFFLWLDLFSHKDNKVVSVKDATLWSAIWVLLALAFMGYTWWGFGADQAQLFLAGYLLEKSLSVDNLFVMIAIFTSFGIKDELQHRVLFYGILGALIMRFIFIAAGTQLVELFGAYALAAFGLFILWTAYKMWQQMGSENESVEDYSTHWSVKITGRFMPIYPHLEKERFFVRTDKDGVLQPKGSSGILKATPLFLCLIVVEISDVMFAFDSVPAIIAITQDPFLVYTSNIFAILGLRSMYFLLAAAKRYLRNLEKSVIAILAFIGIKMMLAVTGVIHLPPMVSLSVVGALLFIGIASSFLPEKPEKQ